MVLSHHERFDIVRTNWAVYAPLSHGCGSMTTPVDYAAFRKTTGERALVSMMKAELPKTRSYKFKTIFHGSF